MINDGGHPCHAINKGYITAILPKAHFSCFGAASTMRKNNLEDQGELMPVSVLQLKASSVENSWQIFTSEVAKSIFRRK